MKPIDALLIAGYVVVSTVAILLVKSTASAAIQSWKQAPGVSMAVVLLLVGAVLYGISFCIWMIILARNELSIVYPLMIGLTLTATTFTAWLILREQIDAIRLLGIAVIFFGIFLVTAARNI